jgi:hypothetical protein
VPYSLLQNLRINGAPELISGCLLNSELSFEMHSSMFAAIFIIVLLFIFNYYLLYNINV